MKLLARLFSLSNLSVFLIIVCVGAMVGKFVIARRIANSQQATLAQAAVAPRQPALQPAAAATQPTPQQVATAGQTRHYYIAADEVEWDYAPSGMNRITGQPFDDTANVFVQGGDGWLVAILLSSYRPGDRMTLAQPATRSAFMSWFGELARIPVLAQSMS